MDLGDSIAEFLVDAHDVEDVECCLFVVERVMDAGYDHREQLGWQIHELSHAGLLEFLLVLCCS